MAYQNHTTYVRDRAISITMKGTVLRIVVRFLRVLGNSISIGWKFCFLLIV
ncbi:hypothetical protein [Bartonella rattaustraliani]|uniref:hypothetical protein n=1 Tax=Bartonella rattaustraliani TaxID=481139 RepID=UPI0002F21604|nr:hypothetical protein [Bartonella rattaustraliani]